MYIPIVFRDFLTMNRRFSSFGDKTFRELKCSPLRISTSSLLNIHPSPQLQFVYNGVLSTFNFTDNCRTL